MCDHTHLFVFKLLDQTSRLQVEWAVNLVIADGHFDLPQEFAWLCMD